MAAAPTSSATALTGSATPNTTNSGSAPAINPGFDPNTGLLMAPNNPGFTAPAAAPLTGQPLVPSDTNPKPVSAISGAAGQKAVETLGAKIATINSTPAQSPTLPPAPQGYEYHSDAGGNNKLVKVTPEAPPDNTGTSAAPVNPAIIGTPVSTGTTGSNGSGNIAQALTSNLNLINGLLGRQPGTLDGLTQNNDGTVTITDPNLLSQYQSAKQKQLVNSYNEKKYSGQTPTPEEQQAHADADAATMQATAADTANLTNLINTGSVPLTAAQQAMIDSIKQQAAVAVAAQQKINAAQLGALKEISSRYGVTSTNPEEYVGDIAAQMTNGQAAIDKINADAANTIAQITMDFDTANYQKAFEGFSKLVELDQKKTDAITTMNEKVGEITQKAQDAATQAAKDLETQKATALKEITGYATQEQITAVNAAKNASDLYAALQPAYLKKAQIDINKNQADVALTKAQTSKALAEAQLAVNENAQLGDPSNLAGYAAQYASTGKMPTGIPKGSFSTIAQIAKQLPHADGTIVSTQTGVAPSASPAIIEGLGALKDLLNKADQLKELDAQRAKGIIGGTIGNLYDANDRARYNDLRNEMVDLLARARTGAAINTSEEKAYNEKLPGAFAQPFFGVFSASDNTRIDDFKNSIYGTLNAKLNSSGLSMYGFTEIPGITLAGGGKAKVGDVITNEAGQQGRVNSDGTITPLTQ